jgi:hypothetical protein
MFKKKISYYRFPAAGSTCHCLGRDDEDDDSLSSSRSSTIGSGRLASTAGIGRAK